MKPQQEKTQILPAESLKQRFTPYEERKSGHVSFLSYFKNYITVLGYGVGGMLAGWLLGKAAETRDINLPKALKGYGQMFGHSGKVNGEVGKWAGAKIGGMLGLYHHWRKAEGQRVGVEAINTDLKEAISPEHLASEVAQERQILEDIQYIRNNSPQNTHARKERERRENNSTAKIRL